MWPVLKLRYIDFDKIKSMLPNYKSFYIMLFNMVATVIFVLAVYMVYF